MSTKDLTTQLSREDHILLKNLDHNQAMLARYDQFFFWSKGICLASIGGAVANINHIVDFKAIFIIPVFFFFVDFLFRLNYWLPKVDRVEDISKIFNKEVSEDKNIYVVNVRRECQRERIWKCMKGYDLWYYFILVLSCVLYKSFVK